MSHRTGTGAIINSAVALMPPTVATISAKKAASRHLVGVRVAAPMVSPTSQPSAAHGSSSTEVRER